jgi:hypothetical protein
MYKLLINKKSAAIILFLFISFAYLLAVADRAPLHLEKNCPCVHFRADVTTYITGVMEENSSGPYVYRVFIPYLVTGIHYVLPVISLVDIDLFLKILFLFFCQVSFYLYLRNFYSQIISISGVFILDILLSFTFSSILGPSIGENADLLNLLIFILALNAIYKNLFTALLVVLFIGTFNRETTLFLIPILLSNDYNKKLGFSRTILTCLVIAIPYIGLRLLIHSPNPNWFTFEGLGKNIPFLNPEYTINALMANIHTLFTLGPLIILSMINFTKHTKFLQMASYITPLFILLHYLVGSVIETRLWIPLFAILIPLSINSLNILLSNEIDSPIVSSKIR